MALVAALTFEQARACVLEQLSGSRVSRLPELVPLDRAAGRVLAATVTADRDYPPLPRSARDGFAVRAADLPGVLRITGEIAAGGYSDCPLQAGEAVEIMTGAPLPPGADSVVMVEHTTVNGDTVSIERTVEPGENYNLRGAEMLAGDAALPTGTRIDYAAVALLATVGTNEVAVYPRPRVAILATGDELVDTAAQPEPYQVRNSNAHALAVQVRNAGGEPDILPVARDRFDSTAPLIEEGLGSDLLLLSGGVSAGKYDIVETVLCSMGAEFFFDRVLIQPGQPLVFGRARGTFFFGLPGNPASTMVTFELFARAALELLGGQTASELPITLAALTAPLRQRPGLTRFLPALLKPDRAEVEPIRWAGSGDVRAIARANAFTVSDPDRDSWQQGEPIRVLIKR
jgi:molybdopterin molybdotransferase